MQDVNSCHLLQRVFKIQAIYMSKENTPVDKTAMMQLIDWVNEVTNNCVYEHLITSGMIISKVTELLPVEKEQIQTAFHDGYYDASGISKEPLSEFYFNKTYKQQPLHRNK